jgi:rhodanese-related sulfurtransferase/glyoxylase-like metal-dependent hydrolase (beta-lactamase superfamily II)
MLRNLLSIALMAFMTLALPALPAIAGVSAVGEIKSTSQAQNGLVIKQFYLGCLSHASYLIGDTKTKVAAVVDPQRDVEQYIEEANKQGLKIKYVILTHVHADFVAGHLELARKTGAEICLGAKSKASFPFKKLNENDSLPLLNQVKEGNGAIDGVAVLKILETPGHTPEAISIVAYENGAAGAKPYAVLTGDCLFIGDVGRPDLLASKGITAQELAGLLYDSTREKLMKLPDDTLVYPAHGAGSLCGKNLSKEIISTIGKEKKTNYALQPMSKEKFVELITADQPKTPQYFSYDASYNMAQHATLDEVLAKALKPLTVDEAIQQRNAGAHLLDGRESDAFAKKHVIDAISIPMNGHYATWAGTFLDHSRPVVIVAEPGKEREAAMRLGRIGFDNVVGYVQNGITAFASRNDLVASHERVKPNELANLLKSEKPPMVVDVRTDAEWNAASIEGAVHMPLISLLDKVDTLPRDRNLVILCASGNRSSTAASLLSQKGVTRVSDLAGGIEAWQKQNLPVKTVAACSKNSEASAPTDENTAKQDDKRGK